MKAGLLILNGWISTVREGIFIIYPVSLLYIYITMQADTYKQHLSSALYVGPFLIFYCIVFCKLIYILICVYSM